RRRASRRRVALAAPSELHLLTRLAAGLTRANDPRAASADIVSTAVARTRASTSATRSSVVASVACARSTRDPDARRRLRGFRLIDDLVGFGAVRIRPVTSGGDDRSRRVPIGP